MERIDSTRQRAARSSQEAAACDACRRRPCVGITPVEAFGIARHVKLRYDRGEVSAIRARLVELAERYSGLSLPQRRAARLPCGLLDPVERRCIAYAARPLACVDRALATDDLPQSPRRARSREGVRVSHQASPLAGVEAVRSVLAAGGLDANRYELNSAVLRALNCPDAVVRWLHREDPFQGCLCIEACPYQAKEPSPPVAVHRPSALPSSARRRRAQRLAEGGKRS
ncbi:MAG: YkgJ family cysteine cluster protein [Pseudomonadota bacterium]